MNDERLDMLGDLAYGDVGVQENEAPLQFVVCRELSGSRLGEGRDNG